MKRVAVVGGGIAGLTAAYYLEKAKRNGAAIEWTLFEKSDRLGGVIRTEHRDGFVLEAGPDSFLTIKPDASQLCQELGVSDQLIRSNDFQRKTYILVNGRLVPIPDGLEFMVPTRLLPMVTTALFSLRTKLRMAAERRIKPAVRNEDESVASFVRRHFGQEMVDRVAEPLLAGVYGGSADRLSVRAVLPRFAEMEREHGSLVRATLQARKARTKSNSVPALFTSLEQGMQQMVDALVKELPASSLLLRQSVSLLRSSGGWQLSSGPSRFDAVLLAVPAPVAAGLIWQTQPQLSALLGKIQYTSSAAVLLAYGKVALPPGFGFLVPSAEGRKMLACTFVHKKFSDRAPDGAALLRCFFSSSRVPDLLTFSDKALQELAQKELQEILGLNEQPLFARSFRWDVAMPQYEVGHLERVAQMESMLTGLPGLQIIGNSFYGIGVPDCIKSARQAVEKILGGS
ncbi:MAG TPA: protoporphyrinogen oxidase [Candidatus Angelobacter sp.]|nr:protoporphyrinogen oxidase [Candidatus Angelobacter sp.]